LNEIATIIHTNHNQVTSSFCKDLNETNKREQFKNIEEIPICMLQELILERIILPFDDYIRFNEIQKNKCNSILSIHVNSQIKNLISVNDKIHGQEENQRLMYEGLESSLK
jgi:hypothetical protein